MPQGEFGARADFAEGVSLEDFLPFAVRIAEPQHQLVAFNLVLEAVFYGFVSGAKWPGLATASHPGVLLSKKLVRQTILND